MTSAADRLLFDDVLVGDDEFPASVRPARSVRESSDAAHRAELTLRAITAIEESRDDTDTHHAAEHVSARHVSARIEAKIDLALGLLGIIAAQQEVIPPVQTVRWSRRGLRMRHAAALPVGSLVICSSYLLPSLPLPVDVPLEVVACEPSDDVFMIWFKVPDFALGVQDGIERELFRRHRRLIAERRASR